MSVMKSLRELSPKLFFVGEKECTMCVTFSSSVNYGYLSMIHAISCMSYHPFTPYLQALSCLLQIEA